MQMNRLIGLMEQGNFSHINEFVPIFNALNQANAVAVDSIARVNRQQQQGNQGNRPQPQPQQ